MRTSSLYGSWLVLVMNYSSYYAPCFIVKLNLFLGKTLQVITLIHTLLVHSNLTKVKRVMVLTPKNALLNWCSEFQKWLKDCRETVINIFAISSLRTLKDRLNILEGWFKTGGVLVIGYTMFASLIHAKSIKEEETKKEINRYLLNPGIHELLESI